MISRVLVAGLDCAQGPIGEARHRRDDGDEVIYAGGGLDAEQIAHIARGEDVRLVVVAVDTADDPHDAARTDPLDAVRRALGDLGLDDVEVVRPVSP